MRKHHAAIPFNEVPLFAAKLRERDGVPIRALEFCILCASRTGEVRGARWSEIDLDGATWSIPAARMKAGEGHRVPLGRRALAILQEMAEIKESDFVFPGRTPGKPLGEAALYEALTRTMGMSSVTAHGFRSSFKDWSRKRGFAPELSELALAHGVGNKTVAAYARDDLLDERRPLMAAWDAFLSEEPVAKVVAFRR
jgi:integrase